MRLMTHRGPIFLRILNPIWQCQWCWCQHFCKIPCASRRVRVVPKAIRTWRKLPVDAGIGETDKKEQLAPRGATNSLWNTFWWNKGSLDFFLHFNIESFCQLIRLELNSVNSERVCQRWRRIWIKHEVDINKKNSGEELVFILVLMGCCCWYVLNFLCFKLGSACYPTRLTSCRHCNTSVNKSGVTIFVYRRSLNSDKSTNGFLSS